MIHTEAVTANNKATKILVYDTSRGFSQFLKSKLNNQFEIDVINNKQEIKKHKASDLEVLFFIVNDAVDAMLFSNLQNSTKYVFLGIAAKHLEERLHIYENVIKVDLEMPKKELFIYINTHLQSTAKQMK